MHQQVAQILNQGLSALNDGDTATAENRLQHVLRIVPNEPNALFLLGAIRKKLGAPAEAITLMRKALQTHPNPAQVNNSLGNALTETGQIDAAVLAYNAAIESDPTYPDTYFNLGLMQHNACQYDDAVANLEKAISLSPNNPIFRNALGLSYQETGNIAAAEKAFKAALARQPDHFKALHNLGALLRTQYRYEEALAYLTKAVQLQPKAIEPRYIIANIHYDMGNFELADIEYRKVIGLDPTYVDAHESLNRMYWEHRKTDLYGKSYIVGIRAAPANAALCEKHLLALENAQRIDEAREYAGQYIENFPEHAGIRQKMARLHAQGGNTGAARDEYETAINLAPENSDIRLDASKLMLQSGDYHDALTLLETVAQQSPFDQRMWAYKGLCWRMLGDERDEWLNDYNNTIEPFLIDVPEGYANLSQYLESLKATLSLYHTTKQAPIDQTLRGGSQTHGRLLDRHDEPIQQLKHALRAPIEDYIAGLPKDDNHPFYGRNRGSYEFSASWSIWLVKDGFHVNHIHTMGWASSSFYVDIPEYDAQQKEQKEGWIKFGESALGLGKTDTAQRSVQPEPGMLVLFPSYMWHGTIPYTGEADRITAPFDLLPD